MHVAFWYQQGKLVEIGTGHKYRSRAIGETLASRGHKVTYIEDDVITGGPDVMVIDHIDPPKSVADRAKRTDMKVVAIDNQDELADVSISALLCGSADYKGVQYMAFPVYPHTTKYNPDKKSNSVFVGMGGFDCNNYANTVLEVLNSMGLNAIVAKSINHPDFTNKFARVEMFEEDNYYDAMHECNIAITNGGLTLFQALHYGMPTIAIGQYDHQVKNIRCVAQCCVHSDPDKDSIKSNIKFLIDNEYHRRSLSTFAKHHVDGKGVERICDIIEGLQPC